MLIIQEEQMTNDMRTRKQTTYEDFVKVVQYKIISSIKNHWKSLEAFKSDWKFQKENKSKDANRVYSRIVANLHIDHDILTNIAGRDSDGKKQLGKFLARLNVNNKILVYKHKKTITYKSGKTFNAKSYFYIPFAKLTELFDMLGAGSADPFVVSGTSEYYTPRQHELIDKWIHGYRRERTYNKTTRFNERRGAELAAKGNSLSADEIEELVSYIDL